jgi:curved DNA-binding protein CbpA
MKDPYEILGIPRIATESEIREAHRRLSLKYHPDKHEGNDLAELAAQKFREVQEAYEKLRGSRGRDSHGGGSGASSGASASQAFQNAMQAFEQRRWADALRELDTFDRVEGKTAASLSMRAQVFMAQDRPQDATAMLQEALLMDNNDGDLHALYASVQVGRDQYSSALISIQRAIKLQGEVPNDLALEGVCLENLGRKTEGKAVFDRLRQIDPNNEVLGLRDQHWRVGGNYVNKSEAKNNACCLCLLLECIFDCI